MDHVLKILIADDDGDVWANSMKMFMRDMPNLELSYVQTPEECRKRIQDDAFSIILLDISFSANAAEGLSLVPEIQACQPSAKIFMLSSHDDDQTMVRCLQLGAVDFISKRSTEAAGIVNVIRSYLAGEVKRSSDVELGREIAVQNGITLASKAMQDVFTKVAFARRNPETPVLITGETGVGKDIVASAIASRTTSKPFVAVDCGAIPETLAESELFGHTKGSFTGADSSKQGKFQIANNGDLFLDEIGNLKRGIQDKLLRALQNKEVTPVGANHPVKANCRILAATNENLDDLVSRGKFRQDLLERLKGISIHIPPLRERTEDIQPIVESLIQKSGKSSVTLAPTCLSLLRCYSWPGNVRELEHIVREMIANVDTGPLTIRHLPDQFRVRLTSELKLDTSDASRHVPGFYVTLPLDGPLEQAEHAFLSQYLANRISRLGVEASKAQIARDLKIARNTLDGYLKRFNFTVTEVGQ